MNAGPTCCHHPWGGCLGCEAGQCPITHRIAWPNCKRTDRHQHAVKRPWRGYVERPSKAALAGQAALLGLKQPEPEPEPEPVQMNLSGLLKGAQL